MFSELFGDAQIYSDDENYNFHRFSLLYEDKNYFELNEQLDLALLKSNNAYYHYFKGHILFDKGLYSDAIKEFKYFSDKDFYQGYFQQALCFQTMKEYGNALDLYNLAEKSYLSSIHIFTKPLNKNWLFPSYAQLLNNRSAVNYNLKKVRAAIEDCCLSIYEDNGYSNPLFMRGCLYNTIGKYDVALNDFKIARYLGHPEHTFSHVEKEAKENSISFYTKIEKIYLERDDTFLEVDQLIEEIDNLHIEEHLNNINLTEINTSNAEDKYYLFLKIANNFTVEVLDKYAEISDVTIGLTSLGISKQLGKFFIELNAYEIFVDNFKKIYKERG